MPHAIKANKSNANWRFSGCLFGFQHSARVGLCWQAHRRKIWRPLRYGVRFWRLHAKRSCSHHWAIARGINVQPCDWALFICTAGMHRRPIRCDGR